jgi:hypothetical protein
VDNQEASVIAMKAVDRLVDCIDSICTLPLVVLVVLTFDIVMVFPYLAFQGIMQAGLIGFLAYGLGSQCWIFIWAAKNNSERVRAAIMSLSDHWEGNRSIEDTVDAWAKMQREARQADRERLKDKHL